MTRWLITLLALSCAPRQAALRLDRCGAVAVGQSTALTAAHCLPVELWEGDAPLRSWRPVKAVRIDSTRDLAWLEGGPWPVVARVRQGVESESVYAVGPGWERRTGVLVSREQGYWLTSIEVSAGWSGSPVFGLDGRLVGVISSCYGEARWVGLSRAKDCRGLTLVSALP